MTASFPTPALPLLVFTDLDGSLLDHDDYGFDAALPALERLRSLNIPLIPATSKTLAEMRALQAALHNSHPFIVENGSAICIPHDYFSEPVDAQYQNGYRLLRLAPPYGQVIATLQALRQKHGYRFRGFHDMSDAEVARDTGLCAEEAALARRRLCTEPLLWLDDEHALEDFVSALAATGLRLLRGGRYWHVTSDADKASAMRELAGLYRHEVGRRYTSIALGDSPNDLAMLGAADIAVVIRRKDGTAMKPESGNHIITTDLPGPAGWNQAMLSILRQKSPVATAT